MTDVILRVFRGNRGFYLGLAAYCAIGLAIFGYNSTEDSIRHGCPSEPGPQRGACYQANALDAVVRGLVWPVYYPASLAISFGRSLND